LSGRNEEYHPSAGKRVLGLETEYIVSFLPSREEPPSWLLLNAVEEAIVGVGRVCDAQGGGYFLSNGGAVSFESRLERRDNPVLELATPESSDPLELLKYLRAQEPFLERVGARAERILVRHGYPGRVIFGRSNRDWNGEPLGTHENYWIKWREPWWRATAGALAAALLASVGWALDLAFLVASFSCFRFTTFLRRFLRKSRPGRFVLAAGETVRSFLTPFPLKFLGGSWGSVRRVAQRIVVSCSEPVLGCVSLRRLGRELVPFLATRQLFAGAGTLSFGSGETPLHLSARAQHLERVKGISFGQKAKSIFDLKPFVRDPASFLRNRKRLCISGGDSLMADGAVFLSIGTTSLVLTMIEEGERFPEAHLSSPVRAWKEISAAGPLAKVETRNRKRIRAVDLQRYYLERAKRFFASCPPGSLPDRIIRLWEGTLECLAENPAALWGRVDWITKKLLLDRLVFPESDWREFASWGGFLSELRAALPDPVWLSSLDGRRASSYLGPWRRRRFASYLYDGKRFGRMRDLFLAASKLDTRYHEVSRQGGYLQKLRAAGEAVSLVDEEAVLVAQNSPPRTTRAAIRGRAIALAKDPRDLEASWETIRVNSLKLSVTIRDPSVHPAGWS